MSLFRAIDYPSKSFSTTTKEYKLDSITIRLIQVKTKPGQQNVEPYACRAWLRTEKSGHIIKQIYFNDIEALGWKYGLFTPRIQPMQDHFVVCKIGDYDGRLYVIDKYGHIADYPGGKFLITADRKYLITEHSADGDDTITVINIANAKKLFSTPIKGEIYQWYQGGSVIFYRASIEVVKNQTWAENKDTAYILDFKGKQVVIGPDLKGSEHTMKLTYTLDIKKLNDCECER